MTYFENSSSTTKIAFVFLGAMLLFSAALTLGADLPTFALSSSMCTLSADEVQFESNALDFSGDDAWVIQTTAGNCGDTIIGGLEGSDDGETVSSEHQFSAGITEFDGFAEIGVDENPQLRVWSATWENFDCSATNTFGDGCDQEDINRCLDWHSQQLSDVQSQTGIYPDVPWDADDMYFAGGDYTHKIDGTNHLFCPAPDTMKASVHRFASTTASPGWTADFTVEADGSETTTLSSDQTRQVMDVGDVNGDGDSEKAVINWQGSMLGSISGLDFSDTRYSCDGECNDPRDISSGSVISPSNFNTFRDKRQGLLECYRQNAGSGYDPGVCTENWNGIDSEYAVQDSSDQVEQNIEASSQVNDVDLTTDRNNVVVDFLEDQNVLSVPSFTITVDADWIGVKRNVAQPELTQDQYSLTVNGGGSETYTVTVQNQNNYGATVQGVLDCDTLVSDDTAESFLPAGGQTQLSFNLDAGSTGGEQVACEIGVADTNYNDGLYQDQAGLSVEVTSTCTDSDSDGQCDKYDPCPNEAGPKSNDYCPIEGDDSDGDGIPDGQDQCPETFGTGPDGCPEQQKEICDNGLDDDGDGLIDERDPDCRQQGSSTTPIVIAITLVGVGIMFRKEIKQALKDYVPGVKA